MTRVKAFSSHTSDYHHAFQVFPVPVLIILGCAMLMAPAGSADLEKVNAADRRAESPQPMNVGSQKSGYLKRFFTGEITTAPRAGKKEAESCNMTPVSGESCAAAG